MLYKIVFLILFFAAAVCGQAKINPLTVTESNLFEDLSKYKTANPNVVPLDLAKKGDELIAAEGLNFSFIFDSNFCQKVTEAFQKVKDKSKPIRLTVKMSSFEGSVASVTLPEIIFPENDCGRCYVRMPLVELDNKTFVTFIQNLSVKFYTPENLAYETINLVDNNAPLTVIRTWKVPYRTTPLGISENGKMIVLDLPPVELKDIALLVYDDGTFRFYPKKDLDLTAKSEIIKTGGSSVIRFTENERTQTLRFDDKCR